MFSTDASAGMDRHAPRPAAQPDAPDRDRDAAGAGQRGGGRVFEDPGDVVREGRSVGVV